MTTTTLIQAIAEQAIAATTCPPFAIGNINGKQVEATVIKGFRNGGVRQKTKLQWKLNGKVVAAANLTKLLEI